MSGRDRIEMELRRFDGRRVATLRFLVDEGVSSDGMTALVEALPGRHEVGASWMLKALAEAGALPSDEMSRVFASLPHLTDPDAILHVLQMARHDPIAASEFREAILPLAGHPRLLVRVWTFDAYCRTAAGPGADADRAERIRQGMRHRSKAMQARARALAREFGVDP